MAGNYSRINVESAGNILTAANYNAEHDNHITNATPAGLDDYSSSVAQMQSTADPGEVGTESLATSTAGELERLRFIIKEITGQAQWYESPAGSAVFDGSGGSTTDNAVVRWDGTSGDSIQNSGVTIDDSDAMTVGAMTVGDGTGTGTTPDITVNKDTGDAGIRLQVNNTSADAWDIYNDNSASDRLKLAFNGVDAIEFTESGTSSTAQVQVNQNDASGAASLFLNQQGAGDALIQLRVNGTSANTWNIRNDNSNSDILKFEYGGTKFFEIIPTSGRIQLTNSGSDAMLIDPSDAPGTPASNTLYADTICKAWAHTNASDVLQDGANLSVSSGAGDLVDYTFATNMASGNYAIVTGVNPNGTNDQTVVVDGTPTASGFTLVGWDITTGAETNNEHYVAVFGAQ